MQISLPQHLQTASGNSVKKNYSLHYSLHIFDEDVLDVVDLFFFDYNFILL